MHYHNFIRVLPLNISKKIALQDLIYSLYEVSIEYEQFKYVLCIAQVQHRLYYLIVSYVDDSPVWDILDHSIIKLM